MMKREMGFKIWLFCIICHFAICNITAQTFTTYNADGSPGAMITDFDQTPYIAGDDILLFDFFEKHVYVNMPAKTSAENELQLDENETIGYQVVMSFRLDTSGTISERRIVHSNNLLMDAAFLKALSQMPDWLPAIIDGDKEVIRVYLPLNYIISEHQIIITGYDEWLTKSTDKNFWLKVFLGGAALLIAALLLLNN